MARKDATDWTGREVSCHPQHLLLEALAAKGLAPSALLEGAGFSLEHLANRRRRISWESYCAMMANAARIWTPEELTQIGYDSISSPAIRFFALPARLLYSAKDFNRRMTAPDGVSAQMFTCIQHELVDEGPQTLTIVSHMAPGYAMCPSYFYIMRGSLQSLTVILGLGPSVVELTLEPNGARFHVTLPNETRLLPRLRRALWRPFAAVATARELEDAYAELNTRYVELEAEVAERARAEAALRQSQQRLRAAQTRAQLGTFEVNPTTKEAYWSETFSRLFGMDPALVEPTLDTFLGLVHPEDRPAVIAANQQVLASQQRAEVDFRSDPARGAIRYYSAQVEWIAGEGGQPGYMAGSVMDMTKQRGREEALESSQANYRTLIEHAPDAIVVLDLEQQCFVDANKQAEVLYGLSHEALLQNNPIALSPPVQPDGRPSPETALAYLQQAAEGAAPRFDWAHQNAQGEDILCEVHLVRLPLPGRMLIRGSITDVRERRAAEARLHLTQFTVDHNADPTFWVRPDGRFAYVNAAACQSLGYTAEELGNSSLYDISPNITPASWQQQWGNIKQYGQARFEEVHKHQDGSLFPVEISVGYLSFHGEEYACAYARDISERRAAEAEREALIAELAAKNEELNRFTHTVSHDLKSPLITIGSFADLIREDLKAASYDTAVADLERIRQAASQMQELLDVLLNLSRAGRITRDAVEVDMAFLVKTVLQLLSGPNSHATVTISDELPPALGDRARLLEVWQNLIHNALKFTKDRDDAAIEIGAQVDGDGQPVYFVCDNGIGIPEANQLKVFNLFERLGSNAQGSGVGLALVQRIVEAHGGRAWVTSAGIDQGSTFYFTLGLPPMPAPAGVAREAAASNL